MSVISEIFEGGAAGVFKGIGDLAKDIRTAITGKDPEKDAEILAKAVEIEAQANQAQTGINLEEAKNPNLFVSGWRPAVGWTCVLGLFYNSVAEPIAHWVAQVAFHYGGSFPVLDATTTTNMLYALLGLGGFRTIEKIKDVHAKH